MENRIGDYDIKKENEMLFNMRLKTYKNSTPVITINGYPMKVEDIVLASVIGGLNLLLVSERGEGKTQILYDVLYGIFGGNGTYIRASPDMDIKDIYTVLNLEKLKEMSGTTEDLIQITQSARHPFTAIDELNRAPPIVQNQLLNVLDGYFEHKGKRYPLGIPIGKNKDGKDEFYHVGIATINFGNHQYIGTFEIDAAILDRFGITLDLDNYPPSVRDIEKILFDEPKLVESTKEDHSEEIFEHFKRVNEREIPLETLLITLYLREGVDYISSEPYSQRKTRGVVPEEVHESADIQGLMRPISIRTAKQIAQAYKAFTYLAELRGYEGSEDYYFPNTLEILKVVLPYSGCLKPGIIESKYYGNPVLAAKDVVKLIREKFEEKKGDIVKAVVKKRKGELTQDDLEKLDGEWKFMREVLEVLKV